MCSNCGALTPAELIRVEEVGLISGTGGLERHQHEAAQRDAPIKKRGETHDRSKAHTELAMPDADKYEQ